MADKFSQNEWDRLAEYIYQEKERRAAHKHRADLERIWKEIDRQVGMKPRSRKQDSGRGSWMPNTEVSKQFNALEVLMADSRRMKFPRGREWYTVRSELTDEYIDKFQERRAKFPIIGSKPMPIKLDQETADTLVKAVIDHYHSLYDFRAMSDMMDAEAFKYGTYVGRVREVTHPAFAMESRGYISRETKGPAVIPCSIKQTYLDDSPMAILHEGIVVAPSIIRCTWKNIDDMKRAAKTGGSDKGWRVQTVLRMDPPGSEDEKNNHIEMIEFEGDAIVPASTNGGSRYLPNVRVLVAVGAGGPKVARFESDVGASYIIGTYLKESVDSPYGVSPLMKGYPIQEAITEAMNRLMAAAALNAQPHILYDNYDAALAAGGGLDVSPGGMSGVDDVQTSIRDLQIGDPAALLNIYLALNKEYDDVTGVNDPRRGAQTKSHTTAYAVDTEQARGQVRTEDYVVAQQNGPMTQLIHQEYAIIKSIMRTPQSVLVNAGGIEGWVTVSAQDLPERIGIEIHGALGPFDEREKGQMFLAATNAAMQLISTAKQLQMNAPELDLGEVVSRLFRQAGENDAGRYIRPSQGITVPPGAAAQGGAGTVPSAALPATPMAPGVGQ